MDRINLHSFYELGYLIHPIISWRNSMRKANFGYETFDLRNQLKALLDGKPVDLRNRKPVKNLLSAIDDAIAQHTLTKENSEEWFNTEIKESTIRNIAALSRNLEFP